MSANDKVYHIYAKDKCLFHSLKEEEFQKIWSNLKKLVGVIKTEYKIEDLSYEELLVNKEVVLNSSH